MIDVLCAVRKDGTYYQDPLSSEVRGPFAGPDAVRTSLLLHHMRDGDDTFLSRDQPKFRLVHNMSGQMKWPSGVARSEGRRDPADG